MAHKKLPVEREREVLAFFRQQLAASASRRDAVAATFDRFAPEHDRAAWTAVLTLLMPLLNETS